MTSAPFGFGPMPGGAYSSLRRSAVDPITGQPVVTSPPTGEVVQRSTLLPIGRNDAGRLVPALPSIVTGAVEAAKFPGQVYRGEAGVYDPATGHVSDEAVGKAFDLAGTAMTGSLPFKVPAGALRSFGGAAAKADPLADLEFALTKGIAENPQAPPTGPRRLDLNAASWDLYHGSTAGPDFRRFDPQASSNPAERGAVFFAPNPETASGYASATAQGGEAGNRVFRTTVEPGRTKVFDLADMAETDPAFTARAREITAGQGGASHGALFDEYMTGFRASRAQDREIAGQLREMGYAPGDPSPISYGYGHIGAAIERAKAEGLDTAILRGLAEHGGDDQVIALTPGRVRSRYSGDLLYAGAPVGLALGAAGIASPDAAQAAPSQGTPPVTASPFGFGAPQMRPEDLVRLFQTYAPAAPQAVAALPEQAVQAAPQRRPLSFGAPQRAQATAGSMTVPLPPTRPPEFDTLAQADVPAPGAQAIMAASETAPPAAEGPSFLDRIGSGIRDNGDLLTSLGIGLMSSPTFGEGAAAGFQMHQQGEGRRAAAKLAQAEYGLKANKLAREQNAENQTAKFIQSKIPGMTSEQATALAGNTSFVNEILKGVVPPQEVYRQHTDDKGNVWNENTRTGQQTVALQAKDDGARSEAAKIEERRRVAESLGWGADSDQYKSYVATGKLPKEDQQSLTVTDKKAILEADEAIAGSKSTVDQLKRALELSKKAYTGPTASLRGYATSLWGNEAGIATQELDNQVTAQALENLKATFGGAPTEGERKILLEIQGASSQAPEVRDAIYNRAIAAAERRQAFNQERANQLRGGSYYKSGGAPSQPAPGAPQQTQTPARDPLSSARDAIAKGASREAVISRLRASGIDPAGL